MKYTIRLDKKPKPRDITPPNLEALKKAFNELEKAIKAVNQAYNECDENAKMYLKLAIEG